MVKTDDEIYEDYINTFSEEERELLRPHMKDTFGFANYALNVRGMELSESIKEALEKANKKIKKTFYGD